MPYNRIDLSGEASAMITRFFLYFLTMSCLCNFAISAELNIKIEGIRNESGKMQIAIFQESENFLHERGVFAKKTKKSNTPFTAISFHGLSSVPTAVAVIHDENSNGVLDRNFLGIPTEGTGFSRNPSTLFGPPDFREAAIDIYPGSNDIAILLTYQYVPN